MSLEIRSSSATALGTPTTTSLGGRPSNAAPASGFFDNISTAENDALTVDYRCVFIYNSGANPVNGVKIAVVNAGNGATVSIGTDSASPASSASYSTATVGSETTAPTITGSYSSEVTLGDLASGQVRHAWLKRTPLKDIGVLSDNVELVVSGTEIIPA